MASSLLTTLHIGYIKSLASHTSSLTYHITTHLRLNAIYWATTALYLLQSPTTLSREDIIQYVLKCWDENTGGFGSHPGHDAHILSTLSAIQILTIYESLHRLGPRTAPLIAFILDLQDQNTGSFAGDGSRLEYDSRFIYCAVSALNLLSTVYSNSCPALTNSLPYPLNRLNRDKAIKAIIACRNFDGGFGTGLGAESHAGQAFASVGALVILNALDELDHCDDVESQKVTTRSRTGREKLAAWLADRQVPNGGLNGRPQKREDVCYSWWVLSSLSMLERLHWVNREKLADFILSAQDAENGGIADRPDNVADVFHTLFGVAGLSLLQSRGAEQLGMVDPVYCMPSETISKLNGVARPYQSLTRAL